MNGRRKNLNLEKMLATCFGLGYIPWAPGTFGTLGGLAVTLILLLLRFDPLDHHLILLFLILSSYIIGVYVSERLKEEWGHDSSRIVIDEAMGFWVSIVFLPIGNIYYMVGAFILFRFFDIAKPLGIRRLDRMTSSHGVMLDDLLAGIYANVVLQIIYWVSS